MYRLRGPSHRYCCDGPFADNSEWPDHCGDAKADEVSARLRGTRKGGTLCGGATEADQWARQ